VNALPCPGRFPEQSPAGARAAAAPPSGRAERPVWDGCLKHRPESVYRKCLTLVAAGRQNLFY
jgi:hypothetical protein